MMGCASKAECLLNGKEALSAFPSKMEKNVKIAYTSASDKERFAALYPFGHFFNHSCCNNAEASIKDFRMKVYALRNIYEGQEVKILIAIFICL